MYFLAKKLSVCFAVSLLSSLVLAQKISVGDENSRRIIAANTIDGAADNSKIPPNVYYQFIFQELISSAPSYLTTEDLSLIRGLPSHNDKRFLSTTHPIVNGVCSEVGKSGSAGFSVLEYASRFDQMTFNYERTLDQHYISFLSQLSQQSQRMIQQKYYEMETSAHVGYSRLKFAGVAAESPELARSLILAGCKAYQSRASEFVDKDIKMTEQIGTVSEIK